MDHESTKETVKPPTRSTFWLTFVGFIFVLILILGFALFPRAANNAMLPPESKATRQENQLEMACQAYMTEYEKLPPTSENNQLVKILTTDNPRSIPFINFKPTDLNSHGELIDPWGTPYRITVDNDSKIHVISAGPDKRFNTADDITNP